MTLEQLMNNPYAWLILSACTVFSVFYGIYAGVKSKEKKEISYRVNTYEIVRAGENMIPQFQMSYGEHPIRNLTVSRFVIWNSGNKLLNHSDIVEEKPLSITSSDKEAEILDASIIKRSEESNKFVINKKENRCVELEFDYMDKKDGVIVQILHTGSINDFDLDCKIKGGKDIRKIAKKSPPSKEQKNFIKIISIIFMCLTVVTAMALLIMLNLQVIGIVSEEALLKILLFPFGTESIMMVVLLDIMVAVMLINTYQQIRKMLYWDIPASLRDEAEYL